MALLNKLKFNDKECNEDYNGIVLRDQNKTDTVMQPYVWKGKTPKNYGLQISEWSQVYKDPVLDQYNLSTKELRHAGINISILATFGGYASSFLTIPFKQWPFAVHRLFYNLGSGEAALDRGLTTDSGAYESPIAKKWAISSQIFNGLSVGLMLGVGAAIVTPGRSLAMRILATSAGFNLTGLTNTLGGWGLWLATAYESEKLQNDIVGIIAEKRDIKPKDAERHFKKIVPNVSFEETLTRQAGFFCSAMGSTTGGLGALLSMYKRSPRSVPVLSAVSGVSFALGLIWPWLGKTNTPEHCKFPDNKNAHFDAIKENGNRALVLWGMFTVFGAYMAYKKGGLGGSFDEIFNKSDNLLALSSLLSAACFNEGQHTMQGFIKGEYYADCLNGVRGLYADLDRNKHMRQMKPILEDYLDGKIGHDEFALQMEANVNRVNKNIDPSVSRACFQTILQRKGKVSPEAFSYVKRLCEEVDREKLAHDNIVKESILRG